MQHSELQQWVSAAFENRALLKDEKTKEAIHETLRLLDNGELRVATQNGIGDWTTHAWIKQAVLLYFGVMEMQTMEIGPFEFYDKIPLKKNLAAAGVRVVPPGTVRFGAHVERTAVIMPGYVNIGAYVGAGTMVDTWATVGSCAQVGKNCHLSGGVGLGGVLEPPGARPVIIEDGCFIGSRCIIVEGMLVETESVIGAGVTLTASTKILDVTGSQPKELDMRIPARSVVIPGTRTKAFPAGEYQVPCALIIGRRKESTDKKTSLNEALRDFGVSV